ncbi:energy transducer TonB [Chiayiivirga flava]|uniref:Protein TonB n=1 Tax=Chiayiivirga flava TaxID=659595 RepID=A0A7W8D4B6_9GAMM|nr:energy transducer TonB [Chiayiivirga flava]MBB5207700.1 protein TonB [Chiayiivirga flava]
MNRTTSSPRQRGRGVVATIVLALVLGAVLVGILYWWSTRPAAVDAPGTPDATATPATPAPEPVVVPEGDPAELAELAMQEKRMFVPPGNNAFELYLKVRDEDADNVQARNALGELFPYAVLYVEQRIAAGDAADGERVLALMQRADAAAPALPRLESQLADVRRRESEQQAEAERRAAAAAAAAQPAAPAAEPPPPAASAPAPAPATSTTAPVSSPPPAAEQPSAPAAATPPPAATPAPSTPPAATPSARRVPVVVSSAQPRYPMMAKRRGITGRVELQFTVLADGSVADIEVVSSEPNGTFDRDAIAAMQRWRFEPGEGDIKARRVFEFKLD